MQKVFGSAGRSIFEKYLGEVVEVVVDRPLGSKHPKFEMTYPINYGYVPGTIAPDGEEIDAYILGVDEPLEKFQGRVVAIIHRLNDNDDKLVVVSDGQEFSNEQIKELTNFQERFFKSEIITNKSG